MKEKIGIILPSRGLIFAEVEIAIERIRNESKNKEIKVYRSSDQPIPQGHNQLVEQALEEGNGLLWFIEEDTVPPAGSLERLMAVSAQIVCIDYGVSGWGCVTKDDTGKILWCGLGCTLVRREVFEKLERPYFRVDKSLRLNDWTWQTLPEEYIKTKNYGTLDIWFCCKAREAGFTIGQVEDLECDHLQLISLGEREKNNGLHTITLKKRIEKRQILNEGR